MIRTVVIDTNVFVSALLSPFGKSGIVLESCFQGDYQPLMGTSLFLEYEDVLKRETIFQKCLLTVEERHQVLNDFLSINRWVRIYYSWRPNLKDEGDNHLIELAVAGGAQAIVTQNIRDFKQSDLYFPEIAILTPEKLFEEGK